MRINPKENIFGQYVVSPDPSITHRALILGCVAKGRTYVVNPCLNDNSYTIVSCIKKLGAKVKIKNGVAEIKPPKALASGARVDCERSESVMRFLCGIAAGSGIRIELTGDKWLCQRPMRNVKEPLEAMGATVALKNYSVPPILVEGETVRPIDYFLPVGSSQVKSSVLLCALTGKVNARVKEGLRSRNHMEIMMREMGADVTMDASENLVDFKASEIKGTKLYVCGDFTEATYFLAQGLLSGRTECKNVGVNPTRTRVLQILRRMGARIKIVNRRTLCGEPIADLIAEKSELKAVLVTDEEAYSVFDELPALALVMGMAKGESIIAEHKAVKELDKDYFDEISEMLNMVGGKCRRFSNGGAAGIAVTGVEKFRGGTVKNLNSAKAGMAAAIALSVSEEGGDIEDETFVTAEYPNFFKMLDENSFVYMCKRLQCADVTSATSFVLEKLKFQNYSCAVKEISVTKKISSEMKESDGFSVSADFSSEAAKKALKYKGVARITKSPDTVKGMDGISTDDYALLCALARAKFNVEDKTVLVLGSGNAAKNIAVALLEKKVASLHVYDPSQKNSAETKKKIGEEIYVPDSLPEDSVYELIVNATSFGVGAKTGESPVCEEIIAKSSIVADFVCGEKKTAFVEIAEKCGVAVTDGEELTFFKAYAAACFFVGTEPSVEQALAFYEEYHKSENNPE